MISNNVRLAGNIMRKFIVLISVFCITLSTGCSNSRVKIRPNPDRENFIKCPLCKGYGKITIETVVENRKDPDINKNSGCYQTLACTSWLFGLWWEITHRDDMEYKNRETDREISDTENSVYNNDTNNLIKSGLDSKSANRSFKKKTVRCHRCNGVGWINRYEYTIEPMYNNNDLDEIIKANEELNKKN